MQAFSWRVASSPSPAMASRAAAVAGSSSPLVWYRWHAAVAVFAVAAHWPLATGIDRRTVPLRTSSLKRSRSVFAWLCSWVRWSARCTRAALLVATARCSSTRAGQLSGVSSESGFSISWRKRAGRLRALRILHLLPLRGSLARRRRAFVVLISFSTEPACNDGQRISSCTNGGPDPRAVVLAPPLHVIRTGPHRARPCAQCWAKQLI